MRLINVETLGMGEFVSAIPKYATLSHRWDTHEMTYVDFQSPLKTAHVGFAKIARTCETVKAFNSRITNPQELVHWVWIDTVCIDKRSSAELSESVNSMAQLYKNCNFCIAYLRDVPSVRKFKSQNSNLCDKPTGVRKLLEACVRKSEWFQRGWTLQELLFPQRVIFFDEVWQQILWLYKSSHLIHEITRIPSDCLENPNLVYYKSVACRMSWASKRITTRKEDEAYCLLGIFGINMPLLYGEGQHAFRRLQLAIIEHSDDESIFAWNTPGDSDYRDTATGTQIWSGILAPHPGYFWDSLRVIYRQGGHEFKITNKGLKLRAAGVKVRSGHLEFLLVQLNCWEYGSGTCIVALELSAYGDYIRRSAFSRGNQVWSAFVEGPVQVSLETVAEDDYFFRLNFKDIRPVGNRQVFRPSDRSITLADRCEMWRSRERTQWD